MRKDGRSQRGALANNLPANAVDMAKAVHGRTMVCRVRAVKVLAKATENTGNNSIAGRVKRCLTILRTFSESASDLLWHLHFAGIFECERSRPVSPYCCASI